ncbi:hypothetical protein F3Y22_tig00111099pilonHSYRG00104 [Hibiscus syriacus]|uniref:Uncharacterized protein n=1 Tax=Hibiscus syriacus TaxID=106335 RepID=A0A6A2Z043_HIBSY|nr:hypothetical protein F3Y22_tig00111099pilonHSYRG00104 [Hibiscus syriacus]
MFLLCNGLLFFIATSSVLFGGLGVESDMKSDKTPSISKGGGQKRNRVDEEEEISNELVPVEEDEEEELGLLSDEDLNKKCEDFIRRMKEGIQLEARN